MAGNQKLTLPKATVDKLRQYIERGACCSAMRTAPARSSRTRSVALGKQLFPMYEFRELPADHPIFTRQQFLRKNWKNPPSVLALSNGTRELMLTLPTTTSRGTGSRDLPGKEETFQVMNDIILYAVDRQNLKYKVVRTSYGRARARSSAAHHQSGQIGVRRQLEPRAGWLAAAGGDPPEGAAGSVRARSRSARGGKARRGGLSVAHLTGTGEFTFTRTN